MNSHSACANSPCPAYNEKEKKPGRLGRLLGKREKTPEKDLEPQTEPHPDLQRETRPEPLPDSAYGSSEANSADGPRGQNTPEVIPAEKNSEIANIDQDRNLALRPSTGEVFDEDTGEIVTVVTTTTTTTTTTTKRGGKKQEDVQRDVKREVQSSSPGRPPLLEMPAGSFGPEHSSQPQPAPAATPTSTAHGVQQPRMSGGMLSADSPPTIPARSAMRKSADMSREPIRDTPVDQAPVSPIDPPYAGQMPGALPASPSRPNFSYPSRSSLKTAEGPMRHNQSTIDDLRAAAKGIHGVGETIRGTFSSTIDRNFPRKNPDKAARANAANEEILERGRVEMEGVPGGWPSHDVQEEPMFDENTPPSDGRPREKTGRMGKLFKRKPVAEPVPTTAEATNGGNSRRFF